MLRQYSGSHEEEFEDFLRYKKRVPVLGGILLDENWEKVLATTEEVGLICSVFLSRLGKEEVGLFRGGRLIRPNQM
jgi:hypothetical protein